AGRRRWIIQSLVDIAEASFEVDFNSIFRLCLNDEDEMVRSRAVEGLWEDEDLTLAGLLVRLLRDDPSESVRAAAVTSLGRFVLLGELEKIEAAPAMMVEDALLGAIYDPHETLEVRRRAVESIAYSGQDQVRDIIEMAYCDDEEEMRISAVFAMGRSADPLWREMVIAELDNPNPEMRYEAARACGELEISAALSALVGLIEADPDPEVQEMAIWALGRIGGKEARRVLEACCESEDEVLRQAAEEALDELDFLGGHLDLLLFESDDWTYER
ncbi:MAG TPA: HEAT repeat domain-containing protein, partial [Anaerolineae bacterium]|nr:HEAT repeat domain-containing protein [Anaerolineae bacterium]